MGWPGSLIERHRRGALLPPVVSLGLAAAACGGGMAVEPAIPDGVVKLSILETDPPTPGHLPIHRAVYVRLRYSSDRPVRIVAYPYLAGRDLIQRIHHGGSPVYPAGEGEVLAWFSFNEPAHADEVRAFVETWQGRRYAEVSLPADFEWEEGAAAVPGAAWVPSLQAARDAVAKRNADAAPKPGIVWDFLVLPLFASVPGYLVLQVLAVWRLRGIARKLAWLPVVPMVLLWVFVAVTALAGSNLSPIWLVFLSPVAVVYLAIVWIAGRRRS